MTGLNWQRCGAALGIALLGAVVLEAQGGAAPGQMMGGGTYDKAAEVTVAATVTEVKTMPMSGGPGMAGEMAGEARGRGMMAGMGMEGGGVHLMATTGTGAVEIHLGPASYLAAQKIVLAAGDRITVIGSRMKMGETDTILARVVRKGDVTMTFRDETGRPLWAGRGRMGGRE